MEDGKWIICINFQQKRLKQANFYFDVELQSSFSLLVYGIKLKLTVSFVMDFQWNKTVE